MNESVLRRSANAVHQRLASSTESNSGRRWLTVVTTVVLATLLRMSFRPLLGASSPFLFYVPGVVFISVLFGFNLGVIATIASLIPANYFLMSPENAFGVDLVEGVQMATFSFVGFSVSWLSHRFHIQTASEERMRSTLASMNEAIISTDATAKITYFNAKAQLMIGLKADMVLNRLISDALEFYDVGDNKIGDEIRSAIQNDDLERFPSEGVVTSSTGAAYRVTINASRILGPTGQNLGVVLVLRS
jgi:PAS domain S-box-containing protein